MTSLSERPGETPARSWFAAATPCAVERTAVRSSRRHRAHPPVVGPAPTWFHPLLAVRRLGRPTRAWLATASAALAGFAEREDDLVMIDFRPTRACSSLGR
jgi:hypothetical protein